MENILIAIFLFVMVQIKVLKWELIVLAAAVLLDVLEMWLVSKMLDSFDDSDFE